MLSAEDKAELLKLVANEIEAYRAWEAARDALNVRQAEIGGSNYILAHGMKSFDAACAAQLQAIRETGDKHQEARRALDAGLYRVARAPLPDSTEKIAQAANLKPIGTYFPAEAA